ncbi:MAG: galactokinase family protein [Candidatus Brocadiia bacterium]|nr:galactokinase family protein [Candidatus Brocadiia bacterium]
MNAEGERIAALRRDVARMAGVQPQDTLVVRSPYRVCPLGAHVDHQLGVVTGLAIQEALLFGFAPCRDKGVRVRSRNFKGEVALDLDGVPPQPLDNWGDYLRGAAWALCRKHALNHGLTGMVDGYDNVGGLSSSAAAGIAYLLALERANGLEPSYKENIELDRLIENEYLGLSNGILDQSTILLSRAGRLTSIDCRSGESTLHPCGAAAAVRALILYSGLSAQLLDTDYNRRVAECGQAARLLLEAADMQVAQAPRLRHVPAEVFEAHGDALPQKELRRARHFFGEQRRVRRGIVLWRKGDLEGFGRLMNESGRSSVENYECGNAYLRTACRVLRETPGVLGARFSGAGFRGCCIGLTARDVSEEMRGDILRRYVAEHPDMEGRAEVRACASADGAGFVDD